MLTGYVIRSQDTGKFVAYPGSNQSYTANVLNARRFATREDARRHACGNERVIDLDTLFAPRE